jgi:membrane protease YdiL (CAAX protease family)
VSPVTPSRPASGWIGGYLEYAARGKNAWWRYAAAVGLSLAMSVVGPALVILPLTRAGLWSADLTSRVQDPGHPLAFFLFTGGVFLALLLSFAAAIRLLHRKRVGDITGAWRWRDFALGFGAWALILVLLSLVDLAIAPQGFRFAASGETLRLAVVAAVALTIQTFTEEFLFRGYVTQGLLLATRRIVPTAILSGLLFGALHIPNGAPQALSATLFGVVLCVIAIRMRGLAFTFGLHLANNLFGAVVLASSGDVFHGTPALFSQNTPQLMWWDGLTGALALLVVAIWVLGRRSRTG